MPTAYTWTPVIIVHAALAVGALLLGAALLKGRKGHRAHRIGGWLWVISMASVAGVSSTGLRPPLPFAWRRTAEASCPPL